MTLAIRTRPVGAAVLDQLANISGARGAIDLRQRLATLGRWVRADLATSRPSSRRCRAARASFTQAAHHLLDLRGKHLRPLCVALASRFGDGFTPRARGLAVAVELVHTATLLHDDVVDVAERRRGKPAAASSTATPHRSSPATGCWSRRCAGSPRPASTACSTRCSR